MASNSEMTTSIGDRLSTFMSDRPIWAFWVLYTVASGAAFGIVYTLGQLLAERWWIAALAVVAAGLLWGTSMYSTRNRAKPTDAKDESAG